MSNVITNFSSQAAKPPTEKKENFFNSETYKNLKALVISDGKLDPAQDKKSFDAFTKARGFGFFTADSLTLWNEKFTLDYGDLLQMAILDTELFMQSVQNPADPNHDKNRLLFKQLDSNKENVRNYFLEKLNEENGVNEKPWKNPSFEAQILGGYRLENPQQVFEYETLKNLLISKFAAIGYWQTEFYVQKFFSSYAISLAPKKMN